MKNCFSSLFSNLIRCAAIASIVSAVLALGGCRSGGTRPVADDAAPVFDEKTSGARLIEEALVIAEREKRNVILLFGANWCPYCRQLHSRFKSGLTVGPIIRKSFIVVPIDVGTSFRNRNVNLIDRYKSNVFTDGTPSLVVLDSAGNRVAPAEGNPWSARNELDEALVAEFLTAAIPTADGD